MASEPQRELSLSEYVSMLYRGRWTIAASFVVGVAAAVVLSLVADPVYEAEATIMVMSPGSSADLPALSIGSMSPRVTTINNQVEILASRTLAEGVLERLEKLPDSRELALFAPGNGAAATRERRVAALRNDLEVQPMKDTDVIVLKASAGGATEAMAIANAYLDEYVDYSRAAARGEVKEVKAFVSEQLEIVRERLHAAEESLRLSQERQNVVGLPEETVALVEQISGFEGLLNQAKTDYGMNMARLEHLRSELSKQMSTLPEDIAEVSSPVILELRDALASREGTRSQLLANGYADDHPKMIEVSGEIAEIKERLINTTRAAIGSRLSTQDPLTYSQSLVDQILVLEVEVHSHAASMNELKKIVDSYAQRMAGLPKATLQLARLERARRVSENTYTMLLETYEEARIAEAREVGEVRVIDRAEEPLGPVSPNKKLNLVAGAILGLGVGLTLTLVREHMTDPIRSIQEIEEATDLTVLGLVPSFGRRSDARRVSPLVAATRVERHLITHQDPRSPVSESYRTLRTNVGYAGEHGPPRSLVVSSAGPGEGKSTTAANLAITMAQQGTRVILVDSDLRRPVLHSIFHLPLEPGLSDVLEGEATLDEAIQETTIPSLWILSSGDPPPNPSELLGSYVMADVVKELSARFETSLFDLPPILLVTDAAIVASKAESTMIVVRAGMTSRKALLRSKILLENVRARIVGAVLNEVPRERGYGGYYQRYYDRYYGREKRRS
ncbi:MAG: polysaccharide biosynthesis tyrosine autokinase [Candidatus Eisenbacteria bacterium]